MIFVRLQTERFRTNQFSIVQKNRAIALSIVIVYLGYHFIITRTLNYSLDLPLPH
jgi:hypothetical protein